MGWEDYGRWQEKKWEMGGIVEVSAILHNSLQQKKGRGNSKFSLPLPSLPSLPSLPPPPLLPH